MAEEERIKKIAKFKTTLKRRIQETETELEGLRALLGLVDSVLLEAGFRRAGLPRPVPPAPPTPEAVVPPAVKPERIVPLKTVTGESLADLHIQEDSMQIVPAKGREFNVNTPPFSSFLVERVLVQMQEKDREAARRGEIPPEKALTYSIVQERDIIQEITIRNVSPDRSRELKSAIRWTLEKMWEKHQLETR